MQRVTNDDHEQPQDAQHQDGVQHGEVGAGRGRAGGGVAWAWAAALRT